VDRSGGSRNSRDRRRTVFIFLRPPLLPEDLRYMALSAAQLDIAAPRLAEWLTHVFIVLGGYAVATGVLTFTLAVTSFRAHSWGAAMGGAIGGAVSIGLMAAINFAIASDFKWVLLGIALLWLCSLGMFWLEKRNQRSDR
jgi:hypothetical protein